MAGEEGEVKRTGRVTLKRRPSQDRLFEAVDLLEKASKRPRRKVTPGNVKGSSQPNLKLKEAVTTGQLAKASKMKKTSGQRSGTTSPGVAVAGPSNLSLAKPAVRVADGNRAVEQPGATSAQAKPGPDSDSYEYYTDSASTSDGQNNVQGQIGEGCTGTAYMLAGCVVAFTCLLSATYGCVVECTVNKQLSRHGQVASRWCMSEPREWRQVRRGCGWLVRAVQGACKLVIEMTTGSVQMDIFTVVMYLPMILQICMRKAIQRVLGGWMGVGLRALAHGLKHFGVHLPPFLVTGPFCGMQAARKPRRISKRGRGNIQRTLRNQATKHETGKEQPPWAAGSGIAGHPVHVASYMSHAVSSCYSR